MRRKELGENTRRKILTTAKKLFVEKGYFNTSMRDIARVAGVSTGAVYHHFESKEEIAGHIYRETLEIIKRRIESAIKKGKTTEERVKGIVRTLLELADEDRYTMEYALYVKHREILDIPVCSAEPFEMLKGFCLKEKELGNIKDMDEELCAVCLTGAPVRMMQLKWDGTIKGSLRDYAEELGECVWDSLKA